MDSNKPGPDKRLSKRKTQRFETIRAEAIAGACWPLHHLLDVATAEPKGITIRLKLH